MTPNKLAPLWREPGLVLAAFVVVFLAAVAARAADDDADDNADADDANRAVVDDDASVASGAAHDDDRTAFRVWPGLGAGARVTAHADGDHVHVGAGAVAAPQLSFSLPLLSWVEPDVTVGFGAATVAGDLVGDPLRHLEFTNRFSFGLRLFAPAMLLDDAGAQDVDAPVRPFVWLALHHGHKVTLANVVANPIGAVLTSSDAGVAHLTGVEGGGGVLVASHVDGRTFPVLVRLSLSYLPSFASLHTSTGGASHGDDLVALVDVAVGLPVHLSPGL